MSRSIAAPLPYPLPPRSLTQPTVTVLKQHPPPPEPPPNALCSCPTFRSRCQHHHELSKRIVQKLPNILSRGTPACRSFFAALSIDGPCTHARSLTHFVSRALLVARSSSRFLSLTLVMRLLSLSLSGSLSLSHVRARLCLRTLSLTLSRSCSRSNFFIFSICLSHSLSRSHTHAHTLTRTHTHTHTRTYTQAHAYTPAHARACKRTHTRPHTRTRSPSLSLALLLLVSLSSLRFLSLPSVWAFSRSPCPALSHMRVSKPCVPYVTHVEILIPPSSLGYIQITYT